MADFRICGHRTAAQFFVLVTSVCERDPSIVRAVQRVMGSRQEAEDMRRDLMIEAGAAIHARGDRVIDVEID